MEKNLDYYLNLDWTLIHGTDLDYNGDEYSYIEIEEFPEFAFCAKTKELALANYKRQLKLLLTIKLDEGDRIYEPGEIRDDEDF